MRADARAKTDPLAAALRKALRDEPDPAVRAWLRKLLRGEGESPRTTGPAGRAPG